MICVDWTLDYQSNEINLDEKQNTLEIQRALRP